MTPHCDGQDVVASAALDRVLETLSKRERRVILRLVKRADVQRTTDLLARDRAGSSEATLHHVHLPKLDAAGYVEWDRETGEIAPGPRYDEAASVLALLDSRADELPLDC